MLEEARDATDMIWQEAERERIGVEAETIRLETLRHRSLEQLGRVYGHLESVLDEVRAGIGRVEEEQEDLTRRPRRRGAARGRAAGKLARGESPAPQRPRHRAPRPRRYARSGTGYGPATRARTPPRRRPRSGPHRGRRRAEQPALSDTDDSPAGDAEATQPVLGDATTETTQPGDKTETIQPLAEDGSSDTANGEGQPGDQDATQRLDAVGTTDNGGNRPQAPKPTAKEGKAGPR